MEVRLFISENLLNINFLGLKYLLVYLLLIKMMKCHKKKKYNQCSFQIPKIMDTSISYIQNFKYVASMEKKMDGYSWYVDKKNDI